MLAAIKPNASKCFICHSKLLGTSEDIPAEHRYAEEHVIPRWLLKISGIYRLKPRERYRLSNGTPLREDATVPCCRRCNNALGLLEPRVKALFSVKRPLTPEERAIVYIWLLKIDYASTFMEYQKFISPRNDRNLGRMCSAKIFNRKKNFHGRVLRHFCLNKNLSGLNLLPFSLTHIETENKELTFSKSPSQSRVMVSWNGSAFRLALDEGKEERDLNTHGGGILSSELTERYFNDNDLIYSSRITYPELRRGRQKTVAPKARTLKSGDEILIISAKKESDKQFRIFGHILENKRICAEENLILILINREAQSDKIHLDEIEIHQPGLRKLTKTAAGVLDFSEEMGIEKEVLTPEREIMMLLFIIHKTLKTRFIINPTAGLPVSEIP